MKRLLYTVTALLAIASCTEKYPATDTLKPGESRITVSTEMTKTAVSHDGGKYSFTWQVGDKISLVEYVAESQTMNKVESDPVASAGNSASFTATLPSLSKETGQKYHYLALHPSSAKFDLAGWKGTGSDAYPKMIVEIPSDQTIPAGRSFDPAADIMVSRLESKDERPATLSTGFARVGGILKINFTGLPKDGSSIDVREGCISISNSSYCFAGSYVYDPAERMIDAYTGGGGTPQINFNAAAGNCPVSDEKATVYLRCCAGDITGVVNVSLGVLIDESDYHEFSKQFNVGGGSTGGGETTGGGEGTGGGGSGTSIQIKDGCITEITIAVEEQTAPAVNVNISKVTVVDNSCAIEAEATSTSGSGLPELNTHIYYNTNTASTPQEFIIGTGVQSVDAGKVEGGKINAEIKDLQYGKKYYFCIALDDGSGNYYYSTITDFTTAAQKQAVNPVTSVNFDTTADSFTASWAPITGATGFNCSYYREGNSANPIVVSCMYDEVNTLYRSAVSGLSAGKYYFTAVPVPDSDHLECTCNTPFEVTISSGGGGGGGKDPVVSISASYNDGTVTVSGKVSDSKYFGKPNQYAYICAVEGEETDPSKINPFDGTPIGSDGSYSYAKAISEISSMEAGKSYSVCVFVGDESDKQYSEVVTLTISGSGGGGTETTKLTISVGGYQLKTSSVTAIVSGAVTEETLKGNNVYIYYVEGNCTKTSDLCQSSNKKSGAASNSTTGAYSCQVGGLVNGKTYSFCSAVATDKSGGESYSEIVTVTVQVK